MIRALTGAEVRQSQSLAKEEKAHGQPLTGKGLRQIPVQEVPSFSPEG